MGADWEEESYREGCAREQARGRLEELDGELLERKPASWSVLGFRERTMVTRFGEVVVRRRLYRDERGLGRFGLDEHLGWKPRQQSSPSLTESIVALASEAPFRKTVSTVSTLTAGVLSTTTVYRLLEGVGERAIQEEHSRWESCFERGEDVSEGEERADVLYTEADGVWVHLQGEDRTHYEVKSGGVYRGWRRTGEDKYELVGKRVYSHGSQVLPFWEGASLEWARQYALDRVKMVVVGGDGANWIRGGVEHFAPAVYQLDGFHLARACGQGYGSQIGATIYEAIRAGSATGVREAVSTAPPAETARAHRARAYVESNLVHGIDWRNRVPEAVPKGARGLGTMESNGDKLIPYEEEGYELDHTWSAPHGKGDPTGAQR